MYKHNTIKKTLSYRFLVLITFIAGVHSTSFSQDHRVDSLQKIIETQRHDTAEVTALKALGATLSKSNPQKALEYAKYALALAEKLGYKKGLIVSHITIGQCYINLAEYNLALDHFNKSIAMAKETGDRANYFTGMVQKGIVYESKGEYSTALEQHFNALKLAESMNKKLLITTCYQNIGQLYLKMTDYTSAMNYFEKGLKVFREQGEKKLLGGALTNVGTVYLRQKKYAKALDLFNEAIEIGNETKDKPGLIERWNDVGLIYFNTSKYDEAIKAHNKALAMSKETDNQRSYAASLNNLAACYRKKQDYGKALEKGNEALSIAKKIGAKEEEVIALKNIADTHVEAGHADEALVYYRQYTPKKDSLFGEKTWAEVNRLRLKYESEKSSRQLALMKAEKAEANVLAQTRKTWMIVAISAILVLLMAFAMTYIAAKNKRRRQEIEITLQKAELEQKAIRSQMNPHFIFNSLNSIQHYILSNETQYAYDYLARFSKLIRQVLANSEHPTISLKKELELLELYIDLEQRRFKNRFEYSVSYDKNLPVDEIVIPVMLIQPFVENAIWHGIMNLDDSRRGKLSVNIVFENETAKITIEDNGVGREAAAKLRKPKHEHTSVGMLFTQKRLEMFKLTGTKETAVSITDLYDLHGNANGTQVHIVIPAHL
ncbi:MAG TPA: tetratricopeptide repeat protein [Flavobacteriales bacterium]|nr:tetratricopeptide repeat protein [Flavobacteriales bacterium]